MHVVEATQDYEDWLGQRIALVADDVARKHQSMHDNAFPFLRATYYRWLQLWAKNCAKLDAGSPRVLSVGDLHIENFGTWRDSEGRLAWGINDFDETGHLSYANDLVRLATSILVAVEDHALSVEGRAACEIVLDFYAKAVGADDAEPFVLEEENKELRDLAMSGMHGPRKFWKKLEAEPPSLPPPSAKKVLLAHLPRAAKNIIYTTRSAGMGGLGVPRHVAWGTCHGGRIAREAKARVPAAQSWIAGTAPKPAPFFDMLRQAVRVPDPWLHVAPAYVVRRIGPHAERIELGVLKDTKSKHAVLGAMGRETANAHWGDRKAAKAIASDLAGRKPSWLHDHASRMAEATMKDWRAWRRGR